LFRLECGGSGLGDGTELFLVLTSQKQIEALLSGSLRPT
jgi:hypothetical protein